MSAVVPMAVPGTWMVAPTRGSPLLSVTVPLIFTGLPAYIQTESRPNAAVVMVRRNPCSKLIQCLFIVLFVSRDTSYFDIVKEPTEVSVDIHLARTDGYAGISCHSIDYHLLIAQPLPCFIHIRILNRHDVFAHRGRYTVSNLSVTTDFHDDGRGILTIHGDVNAYFNIGHSSLGNVECGLQRDAGLLVVSPHLEVTVGYVEAFLLGTIVLKRIVEQGFCLGIAVDRYGVAGAAIDTAHRSEEHTSELQSRQYLVCRLLLEKKIVTSPQ